MMTLWHRTRADAANAILRDGFRDAKGTYFTDREFSGVWLSDRTLDENEGACGEALLRVSLDCAEGDIRDFEWIEEGKSYREWLIPASFVNAHGTIERLE